MATPTSATWWKPGHPDRSIPGVLFEDEEHGRLLKLDGSFEESPFTTAVRASASEGKTLPVNLDLPSSFELLLGTTNAGKLISLFDCQVIGGSYPMFLSRGSLTVLPRILAYDLHFENWDDFRLTSLSARYSNLDTWVATSGFLVQFAPAVFPVSMTYTRPDSVDASLPEGVTIGIGFSASGPSMPARTEFRIEQQSWVTAKTESALPFERLQFLVADLANLISLGVGKPLRELETTGQCRAKDARGSESLVPFKIVHNREPLVPVSREVESWDMLFTLVSVRDRFADLTSRWFSRDESFKSLCDLYFGTTRSPFMYVEHRLLNMFQALESYDRRVFQPASERKQKHQERLSRILGTVEGPDQRWLKNALRHSHEPAAADRIRRLVKTLDADWLLSGDDIRMAADLRNFYTHFDAEIEHRLPAGEERIIKMHNLGARLRILCELILLDLMGFSKEEVREGMMKTRRVERFTIPGG